MIFRRIYDDDLAQAAYLIACEASGEALVVDPVRDVATYLRAAEEEGVRIVAVTETHVHADFISGSRELARHVQGRLLLSGEGGPHWQYAYATEAGATLLRDGDVFDVGRVRIQTMHTPGHTPEHLAFLVTDMGGATEPMGVMSGDSLFVGDVGRPDLLVRTRRPTPLRHDGESDDERDLRASSKTLHDTLSGLRALPDHLQVWPGHGAGSPCGKSLSAVPQSTIGYERRFNPAFRITDTDEFVSRVLDGQPDPPRYFARMKRLNRDDPPATAILPSVAPRAPGDLAGLLRGGVTVIDTRPTTEFVAGHLPGSISVPLHGSFVTWAGSVLGDDVAIALVVTAGPVAAERALRTLSLIGIDDVQGIFDQSLLDAAAASGTLQPLERVHPAQLSDGAAGKRVIDVRSSSEWASGHIPGALHVPLAELADALERIPPGPTVVHCQGGTRSVIAASALRAAGRADVTDLAGGFAAWRSAGRPIVRDEPTGGDAEVR